MGRSVYGLSVVAWQLCSMPLLPQQGSCNVDPAVITLRVNETRGLVTSLRSMLALERWSAKAHVEQQRLRRCWNPTNAVHAVGERLDPHFAWHVTDANQPLNGCGLCCVCVLRVCCVCVACLPTVCCLFASCVLFGCCVLVACVLFVC